MIEKEGYSGHMVPSYELPEHLKKMLARIINEDVLSEKFLSTERLLSACAQLQFSLDLDEADIPALKSSIKSIANHFSKINEQLASIDGGYEGLFDQHFFLANDSDHLLLNMETEMGESGYYYLATAMEKAALSFLHEFNQRTKGRRPDYTYSDSLLRLKNGFAKIFPDRSVSKEPESLFFQLVVFWLNSVLGKAILDPTRHIEKILSPVRNY